MGIQVPVPSSYYLDVVVELVEVPLVLVFFRFLRFFPLVELEDVSVPV
jgi:hypothetical protein